MELTKRYFTFFCVIVAFGCNSLSNTSQKKSVLTITYSNGKPFKKIFIDRNDPSCRMIQVYYENGNLKEIFTERDKLLHGVRKLYYPNEKLSEEGNWSEGKRVGVFKYYSKDGGLNAIREFIIVADEPKGYYLNRAVIFDSRGDTIKGQSTSYKAIGPDTIRYGQKYTLKLVVDLPMFKNGGVVVGDFDSIYHLLMHYKSDTVMMDDDLVADYETTRYVLGVNHLRGFIYNYDEFIDSTGKGDTRGHTFYFERTFYVQK